MMIENFLPLGFDQQDNFIFDVQCSINVFYLKLIFICPKMLS